MSHSTSAINNDLKNQIECEMKYWREVLKRVISVIKFLAERGLPFRGDNEILGSPHNGNFLGLLELLSEYDEFLKAHLLKYGNQGKGNVSYISSTIYEELIKIMSQRVLDVIISNIKKSKYYGISVDSTTDISHADQLCLTFRYMEDNKPVERFLKFFKNEGHAAEDHYKAMISFLEEHDISIKDCRGQSYDNASVMSGKYNGLQALIRRANYLALWIPCFAHSLNLIGTAVMACSNETKKFFDFLENLYVFFTGSSDRFDLLTDKLKESYTGSDYRILVPKRVSTTRCHLEQNL